VYHQPCTPLTRICQESRSHYQGQVKAGASNQQPNRTTIDRSTAGAGDGHPVPETRQKRRASMRVGDRERGLPGGADAGGGQGELQVRRQLDFR